MNRFFISSIGIFLICSSGQCSDIDFQKRALEGQWKFISADKVKNTPFLNQYPKPHIFPDESPLPEPPYDAPDLIFEQDSIYELNYPESLSNRNTFSSDSGYLVLNSPAHRDPCPFEFINDTLYIYKPYHGSEYIKEVYVKTTFDEPIVALLKREGVNYPELAGTWFLIRQASVGDGTEYLLDFPYKIPNSIKITRQDFVAALEKNRVYFMTTNGQKRDYTFSYKWGYLVLTPGSWYKGKDPWIHFSRKENP